MTVFKTSVLALWLALSGTPAAFSQGAAQYPAKPIRIVVPNPAGGGIDVLSRVIGERLSHSLGQPVLALCWQQNLWRVHRPMATRSWSQPTPP